MTSKLSSSAAGISALSSFSVTGSTINIADVRGELSQERLKSEELAASLEHIQSTKAWGVVRKLYELKRRLWLG